MYCAKAMLLTLAASSFLLLASFSGDDFEAAERFFQGGEFRQAEALYSRIKPGHPQYSQAVLRLGTIYYATERPAQAERSFEEYLRFRESPEAYCLLAGAQFNQKKFAQAYESAKKALRLEPRYAKAYTALGMIYAATGDWPDSQAAYQESLRLKPDDPDTWFMLGRGYFLRDDFPHAQQAFENVHRLSPEQVRTYENLALTLDLMNQPEAADRTYLEGIRMNQLRKHPEPKILIAYGKFLAKEDRAEDSLAQFREAVRVAPLDGGAHYEMASQLARMKRWSEAAQEGEVALRNGGATEQIHYLLARIYTALGKADAASQHAREAARLAQNQP